MVIENPAVRRPDALDPVAPGLEAAIGEGGVGLGHLQRTHLDGAEGHGRVELDVAGDPQAPRRGGHISGADLAGQPGGDGVGRLGQGLFQGHFPPEVAAIVARLPVADAQGLVDDADIGGASLLHGRQIDEGLEGRTGLTPGHGRPVELALLIIGAANIGPHPAFAVEGHQGALADPLIGAGGHPTAQGLLGGGLDGQVQGGLDHQIVGGLAHQGANLVVDPVDEILRPLIGQGGVDPHRVVEGLGALFGGDGAQADHFVQHHGGAAGRPVGGRDGAVARGPLHHAGQQGRLADGELRRRLVEIALRGGLDPIGAAAEIDPVQIELENLLLGEFQLQPDGQDQLLSLAAIGLGRGQEEVARQLLGDGRAAAQGSAVIGHIIVLRADDAPRIEARVPVEPAVLDGDEGFRHMLGQRVEIHRRGVLRTAHRDQGPGPVQIGDRGLALDIIELGGVGQVDGEDGEEGRHEDEPPDPDHGGPIEEGLQRRAPGAAAAARAGRSWRLRIGHPSS